MADAASSRDRADQWIDLDRPVGGDAPVPGAQWDELHERWERWDEQTQSWHSIDTDGRHASRPEAAGLPQVLREASTASPTDGEDDLERPRTLDLDRLPEPPEHVAGAQWNEVTGRWERWDESAETWVEASASA